MSEAPSPLDGTLPLKDLEEVNARCLRFEEAWQQGTRPPVEDYLANLTGPTRTALLAELLLLDLHYRRLAGASPSAADYLVRFPNDATLIHAAFSSSASDTSTRMHSTPVANSLTSPGSPGFPEVPGYEILEELGRGGMGVVYQARQIGLNRLVALKVIRPGGASESEALARFRQEAEAVARLRHPNIVQIHEVGEHAGRPYFSMEYVEGGGLDRKLRERLPAPEAAATLVEAVARAVHAVHRCGLVHRDLKPANVLLTAEGTPKVGDFGLARRLDEESGQTATGQVLGTPSYMAPEQASGGARAVTPAADVYALGAILYECLTGRPPFRAATWQQTLQQVIEEDPVAPRRLNPATPRDLEIICLKCLKKSPLQRYADADALAEDLRRFRSGETILARPAGRLERVLKWVRRRPAVAALVIVSALAAVALTGVLAVTALLVHEHNVELGRVNVDLVREKNRAVQAQKEADARARQSQEERRRAEAARHAIQMDAGLRAWQEDDILRAEQLLKGVPHPLQSAWEYQHLWSLVRRKAVLRGKPSQARAVAFNWDGTRLAHAIADRTIRVWDLARGTELLKIEGMSPDGLCFSPDGSRLVGVVGGTVRVWDASSGAELLTINKASSHRLMKIAFSPDGTRLAGAGFFRVAVWDARTGLELLSSSHANEVHDACFDPEGKRLATAGGDGPMVTVLDLASRKEVRIGQLRWSPQQVRFSPDGSRLAGAVNRTVRVWDPANGAELLQMELPSPALSLCFSADGTRLATGCQDGKARVWNARSGQLLLTLRGHTGAIQGVCFNPDWTRLTTAGSDGRARVWNLAVSQQALTLPAETRGGFNSFAFSPNGQLLAVNGPDSAWQLWDLRTGQEVGTLKGGKGRIVGKPFAPDGKFLATVVGIDRVQVWDIATGERAFSFKGPVQDLHFSADGKHLVAGKRDVLVRDARTGDLVFTLPGQGKPSFSPDGKLLVTQQEGAVRVWNAEGRDLFTLRGHHVTATCFTPDGKFLATGGKDRTVKVWEATTGREVHSVGELPVQPQRLVFSPDGRRLAITGSKPTEWPQTCMWDCASGELLFTLRTDVVSYSPDGQRLVAVELSMHGTTVLKEIRVWDALTGQPLLALGEPLKGFGVAVRFSPNGKHVVAAADGTVRVWYGGPEP